MGKIDTLFGDTLTRGQNKNLRNVLDKIGKYE